MICRHKDEHQVGSLHLRVARKASSGRNGGARSLQRAGPGHRPVSAADSVPAANAHGRVLPAPGRLSSLLLVLTSLRVEGVCAHIGSRRQFPPLKRGRAVCKFNGGFPMIRSKENCQRGENSRGAIARHPKWVILNARMKYVAPPFTARLISLLCLASINTRSTRQVTAQAPSHPEACWVVEGASRRAGTCSAKTGPPCNAESHHQG